MSYGGGLFGCFNDCAVCVYGFFCPFCLNAQNHATIRNETCSICHFFNNIPEYWIRKHMHAKSGEPPDQNCRDCAEATFCFGCAICQDARGLKAV